LKHHSHQGAYEWDADLANHWEARLVGNSWYRKAMWLMLFPFFQVTRPPRLKAIRMWDRWFSINLLCAAAYDVAIVYFCGWPGFLYLVFAFLFSIGLHPVGARWIQEHYTYDFDQETFSYYGPINLVALNMGYHNEHHDLPSIPWNNLPKLRAMAPEFYNNLKYHSSWSRLLFQFIFDRRYSLYSRVERMRQLASMPNTGGLACLQADADSPEAQKKIPSGSAAISNALRTTRSTSFTGPGNPLSGFAIKVKWPAPTFEEDRCADAFVRLRRRARNNSNARVTCVPTRKLSLFPWDQRWESPGWIRQTRRSRLCFPT
jgi:hypothetical protein